MVMATIVSLIDHHRQSQSSSRTCASGSSSKALKSDEAFSLKLEKRFSRRQTNVVHAFGIIGTKTGSLHTYTHTHTHQKQ